MLIGCTGNGYTPALQAIDSLINDSPDSALSMLKGMASEIPEWSKAQRMRYHLLTMKAQNKAYVDFTSDSLAKDVVEYYDNHGTANDRLLAHYLLGCVYRDLKESPHAVDCFLDAAASADTTARDCDYYTLSSVYSQMADQYRMQLLLSYEIDARWKASHFAALAKDTLHMIYNMDMASGTYILINKVDSGELIQKQAIQLYRNNGYVQKALQGSTTLMYLYVERPEKLSEAKVLMDKYEAECNMFDHEGNLPPSKRLYFYYKGRYYDQLNRLDSAEYYYRKVYYPGMSFSAKDGMYRGLLSVFQKRHLSDSIAKYARLYCEANDSSIAKKDQELTAKMSASYNYNRYQKQAVENAWKVSWAIGVISALILVFTAVTIIVVLLWRKKKEIHRKQVEAFNKLKGEYDDGKERLRKAKEDLEIMEASLNENNTEHAQLLEKKNSEILSYLEQIKELETKLKIGNRKVTKKELMDTPIYQRIQEVLSHPKQKMLKEDWAELRSMIDEKIPSFYSEMNSHKEKLSQQDYDICILVRLYLSPKEIVILTNSTSSAISMKRSRLLKKIFGMEGSPEKFDEMVQNIF